MLKYLQSFIYKILITFPRITSSLKVKDTLFTARSAINKRFYPFTHWIKLKVKCSSWNYLVSLFSSICFHWKNIQLPPLLCNQQTSLRISCLAKSKSSLMMTYYLCPFMCEKHLRKYICFISFVTNITNVPTWIVITESF